MSQMNITLCRSFSKSSFCEQLVEVLEYNVCAPNSSQLCHNPNTIVLYQEDGKGDH